VHALNFFSRAFVKPEYSPLATLARGVVSGLNLPKKMVDSAPKVFAACFGVAFSVSATILFVLGASNAGVIVLGILILCATLEAFLGFCLGCWMYSLFPQNIAAFTVITPSNKTCRMQPAGLFVLCEFHVKSMFALRV